MRWVRIAVLGKPGTQGPPEPTKVRLIAVENLILRCWATSRALALMPWLTQVIGNGVMGGVRAGQPCQLEPLATACVPSAERVVWRGVKFRIF